MYILYFFYTTKIPWWFMDSKNRYKTQKIKMYIGECIYCIFLHYKYTIYLLFIIWTGKDKSGILKTEIIYPEDVIIKEPAIIDNITIGSMEYKITSDNFIFFLKLYNIKSLWIYIMTHTFRIVLHLLRCYYLLFLEQW